MADEFTAADFAPAETEEFTAADFAPAPVVRSAPAGSLQAHHLLPAVRLIGGDVVTGDQGDTHPDIITDNAIPATDIDQRGFSSPMGFMDRESAATALLAPTAFEPGRLHSTDLSTLQEPGGYEKQLQKVAQAEETPEPLLKLPELPEAVRKYYALPPRLIAGERGGQITEGAVQALYDAAKSLPEFFTTEEGVLSALAGLTPLGRAGVTAYFTYDMAKSLLDQAGAAGAEWDNLSTSEKAQKITQAAVTLGFVGMLSSAGIGQAKGAVKTAADLLRQPPETAPPTERPGGAPPTAPAEVKAEVGEVPKAAPTEPAVPTPIAPEPERQAPVVAAEPSSIPALADVTQQIRERILGGDTDGAETILNAYESGIEDLKAEEPETHALLSSGIDALRKEISRSRKPPPAAPAEPAPPVSLRPEIDYGDSPFSKWAEVRHAESMAEQEYGAARRDKLPKEKIEAAKKKWADAALATREAGERLQKEYGGDLDRAKDDLDKLFSQSAKSTEALFKKYKSEGREPEFKKLRKASEAVDTYAAFELEGIKETASKKVGPEVIPTRTEAPAPKAPEPAAPEPAAKEPWQMTQDEWFASKMPDLTPKHRALEEAEGMMRKALTIPEFQLHSDRVNKIREAERAITFARRDLELSEKKQREDSIYWERKHREAIVDARDAGKPIPAEVLADYPDLKPTAPAAEAPKAPAAGGKAPESGRVTYRAPATGKKSRWVKVAGDWFRADSQWKPKGKALEPMALRDALEAQLVAEAPKPPAPAEPLPRPVETRLSPSDKSVTPEEKRFRATAEGQKAMASRASRIAVLSQMNEAIRKLNPDEAYDRSLIETIPDSQIDKWMEDLRQTWNKLKAPAAPQTAAAKVETGKPTYEVSFESPSGGRATVSVRRVKFDELPDSMKKLIEEQLKVYHTLQDWKEIDRWEKVKNGKTPVTLWEKREGEEVTHNISLESPETEFKNWAMREDLYDKKYNAAGQGLRDKLLAEREATEKAAEDKRKAEEVETTKKLEDFAKYRAVIEKVQLPKGETQMMRVVSQKGDESFIRGVKYGDWFIHKVEGGKGRYAQPTVYKVSHFASGLGISGDGLPSLQAAKNYVRALIHGKARGNWIRADQLTKVEKAHLMEIGRAWAAGGDVPSYFKAEATPPPPPSMAGPGTPSATQPSDVPGSQLAQLTQAIRQQSISPKEPLRDRIAKAINIADRWAAGKDAVTRGIGHVRAASSALLDAYLHLPEWRDFQTAVGRWTGADQATAFEVRNFRKTINAAVPNKLRQEAITNWIQADGDETLLRERAAASRGRFKRGYEVALELNDAEKTLARNVSSYLDARLQEGINAGLLKQGVDNYITQIWRKPTTETNRMWSDLFGLGKLNPNFRFARKRIFDSYFEGEQAGFVPRAKDVGSLISAYDLAFNRSLSARGLIKELHEGVAADGNPIVMISGSGVPVPKDEPVAEAFLIKPKTRPQGAIAEDGRPYRKMDHWALEDWKWVAKSETGQNIFVKGDMLVHPDHFTALRNALKGSVLRQNPVTRFLLQTGSLAKQTKLSLSPFHTVQEGLHSMAHRVDPTGVVKSLATLDLNHPQQRALVDHGLMVADTNAQELFAEGLSGGGLIGKIPGLGRLQQWYTEKTFQDFIPRLKMTMALDALERNRKTYTKELASGKVTDDQIVAMTARQSNAAFGEQNYRMMGRSPTLQDFLRLSLLAPDFLEARFRFVGQALKPYGREQQVALGLMAATLYTTSRLMNKALDDDYHWDKPFSVFYKGREYHLRTLLGDVQHLLTDPRSFWYNRLAPITRTMSEYITGRDDRGIKRSSVEQFADFLKWFQPIPLQRRPGETPVQQVLQASGVPSRLGTKQQEIYQLADSWLAKQTDPKIKAAYDRRRQETRAPSPYTELRQALRMNELGTAARLYTDLLQSHKPESIAQAMNWRRPVTGSLATEQAFRNSLSASERKIYDEAVAERKLVADRFIQVVRGLPRQQVSPRVLNAVTIRP